MNANRIPFRALEQCAPERGSPRDMSAVDVDLVLPNDSIGRARSVLVLDFDDGAEENDVHSRLSRFDDHGPRQPVCQPSHAPVNFA